MKVSKTNKLTSRELALLIADFAAKKKADNIVILDMRKAVNFCDYFVICSSTSQRRMGAIADGIDEELAKFQIPPRQSKGDRDSHWMLLDYGDVVVHVFTEDLREFYGLEHLWQDAPKVRWKAAR